jgi:hypothetical protein
MSKDKEKDIFPEPSKVTIGFGENAKKFDIYPLVRAKYKEMFKMIGDVIREFVEGEKSGELEGIDLDNIPASTPTIVQVLGDKLGDIYAYYLDHENQEEMLKFIDNNMTMAQEAEMLLAIIEQNDIQKIVKNFKKVAAVIKVEQMMKNKGNNSKN